MSTSEQHEPTPDPAAKPVDQLLASPELAKAVENDDFKRFLDHIPVGIAVSKLSRGEQRIVYVNRAFEAVTGVAAEDAEHSPWSIVNAFVQEDDASVALG